MKRLIFLSLLGSFELSAQTNFCQGKAAGTYYCLNESAFQHCTGNSSFVLKACPANLCVTRTPADRNPCVGKDAAAREDGIAPPVVSGGQVVLPLPAPPPLPPVQVSACVGGPKFDPAGTKNVGNGRGIQFIGGQCLSGLDCKSGCCAGPCGICSGIGAQFQSGKNGCGFGD